MAESGHEIQPHHDLLITELQALADRIMGISEQIPGVGDRLQVSLPPGSAKSTYASKLFPAWLMAVSDGLQFILASHTGDLAEVFSRQVMSVMREFCMPLFGITTETDGVKGWSATNGSTFKPVGIGGPITGRRADIILIDDPVRSWADAQSLVLREGAWNWLQADAQSRLKPGGVIGLIMTRWHADDLAGRCIEAEPTRWKRLNIRAESIGPEDDPLGRPAGEFIWDNDPKYAYGELLKRAKKSLFDSKSAATWYSLYQGDPRPAEGGLFQCGRLGSRAGRPAAVDIKKRVRAWDIAATAALTRKDPDWTVGVEMAEMADGTIGLLDVVRFRAGPDEVERRIVETAQRDGIDCHVDLPQDPGQAGKWQATYLIAKLRGHRVRATRESGDKATRAGPFASQLNAGLVWMVGADWNAEFVAELEFFPQGKWDDQIDATSRGFGALFTAYAPASFGRFNRMGR